MKLVLTLLLCSTLSTALAASSDAEIIKVLETVNSGEVEMARLALKKSRDPNVERYAEKMLSEHNHNNERLTRLGRDLTVAPSESSLSDQFSRNVASNRALLSGLECRQFDRVYVDAMVNDHKKVLEKLEMELIPAARDSALREHLIHTKEHVSRHLHHAKKMQSTLRQ